MLVQAANLPGGTTEMGQGSNLFFNTIAVVFLVLTVIVGLVVLSVASGSMEPPILAPEATLVPPTERVNPTLTPSMVPGAELTLTPEATAQPGS
jgi:hypothetical protein